MSALTLGWPEALQRVAQEMRKEFHQHYPFSSDEEVSPRTLSMRDAIYIFPVRTKIALLDFEGVQRAFKDDQRYWTVLHYDLLDTSGLTTFEGVIPAKQIAEHDVFFYEKFGMNQWIFDSMKQFNLSGAYSDDFSELVDVAFYDVREREAEYAKQFLHWKVLQEMPKLQKRFSREPDYAALYDLKNAPIIPASEFFQPDNRTRMFVRLDTGEPLSIEDWQLGVADLVLTPLVPESVHTTFNRAKRMYVLAYMEYDLFTTAIHYAHLALDAAFYTLWSKKMPVPIKVEKMKNGRVVDSYTSPAATHYALRQQLKQRGWHTNSVLLSGKPFPAGPNQVLEQLCADGLITTWQMNELKRAQHIRNSLTHLEFAPTYTPAADMLRFACHHINLLFDDGRAKAQMLRKRPPL